MKKKKNQRKKEREGGVYIILKLINVPPHMVDDDGIESEVNLYPQ